MPPNMRPVIAQLHRNSRSIGYGQQTRSFASSAPVTSSESKQPWWYIRRALAVGFGYYFIGPCVFTTVDLARYEKKIKERDDEFVALIERRMSSVRK